MSDRFQVTSGERGLVRVFALDLPPEEIGQLREAELANALGVEVLDVDQIDLFTIDDLQGLGLVGYMTEGLGIAEAELEGDRARLEALKGTVLIVRSAAFGGQAAEVVVRAPLRWVGTYAEEHAPVSFEVLPSESAAGNVNTTKGKPVSDAAMSGRVAMAALVVLIALTAIMVWVAAS